MVHKCVYLYQYKSRACLCKKRIFIRVFTLPTVFRGRPPHLTMQAANALQIGVWHSEVFAGLLT